MPQPPGMTLAAQARLAGDWATILQSEQAALAVDREVQEALLRMATALAQQAATLHGQPVDAPSGPAGTDAAAWPSAVDDASPAAGGPLQPARDLAGLG